MIKKEIKKDIQLEKTSTYIKMPVVAVIIFLLLLTTSSFFAGAAWIKIKNGSSSTTTKLTTKNVFATAKTDKPQLDFYVMSFCPYGNQMETTLQPVFDLLGNKAELRPRYIFDKIEGNLANYCKQRSGDVTQCSNYIKAGYFTTEAECKTAINDGYNKCNNESSYLKIGNNLYSSFHGRIEANQDVREICAYNLAEDKKLWWDFVKNVNDNCDQNNADTCWEEQAKKAGLDSNKITECFNKDAASLIEKEIADTTKNKIQGSPSLMIGDQSFPPEIDSKSTDQNIKIGDKVYSLNDVRTPNVIKEAICSVFTKAPKECKTALENVDGTAATVGASCN